VPQKLCLRDRRALSGDSFVQPLDAAFGDDRQKRDLNVGLSERPNLSKLDSLIAAKVGPFDATEQVRAKMSYDERRNLRITVLYTSREIWR